MNNQTTDVSTRCYVNYEKNNPLLKGKATITT
jgi:hypothetical protein